MPLRTTAFRVRLVATTSILLHARKNYSMTTSGWQVLSIRCRGTINPVWASMYITYKTMLDGEGCAVTERRLAPARCIQTRSRRQTPHDQGLKARKQKRAHTDAHWGGGSLLCKDGAGNVLLGYMYCRAAVGKPHLCVHFISKMSNLKFSLQLMTVGAIISNWHILALYK